MKNSDHLPKIVDKDEAEIKHIISLIKNSTLPEDVKIFVIKCIELALWFPLFLQKKNATLLRLRRIIFGKGYNKSNKQDDKNKSKDQSDLPNPSAPNETATSPVIASTTDAVVIEPLPADIIPIEEKKPGHGRMPHTVYENSTKIQLLLNLTVGDDCPELCGGKLGNYQPGIIVRVKGQNFAQVYEYSIEKLRCNLCGLIVKADIPEEVGDQKYDASFIAMLMLMKYYLAVPFYRQENFQRMLKFPLSDATQWGLIEEKSGYFYPVFNKFKKYAANASVIHNDDTRNLILEVIKQIKEGAAGDRTGMYTTGIIAMYEGHQIALFMNGRQHAGENLSDILKLRDPKKDPIIQMCDALSANIPKAFYTILCNCLSHGFRKFEEIKDFFEEKCFIIMSMLSNVFEHDATTRDMSKEERLAYHQQHSQPIMDGLKQYMEKLIVERHVEPNSELGKAIKYMQRHWVKLTRFLTVAGAPIDNNIVERGLKLAIRNRKSAMFYRTLYSASIGAMVTSIIYTCYLANQNPHDYLVALQTHHAKVLVNPERWMPWNYLATIAEDQASDANHQGLSPPMGFPAAA